ncbi:SGNH/GDSL hydrolase family protein [Nocardia iowensis]|uniref:SGNH/GDSL hydrolase family protein n=1 Tax=Nocardia iowensis TaxID=204891 RepID=A0ABX8RFP1_NOCIO|nr:SGNH/GDSL hydrolase family protein [Nocardia iowensis]QXN88433.1 SGNH/GDSL hydrolase family protein [Nocardia iowensis]
MSDPLAQPILTEDTDPYCLDDRASDELLAGAPWRRYAVLGDSVAAGTGDPSPGYRTIPWADRVAAALRRVQPDLAYLNTGRLGAVTGEVVATQLDPVLRFEPDLVHVNCGANDLLQPEPDVRAIRANLDTICTAIGEIGARITMFTFVDVKIRPRRPALRARLQALIDLTDDVAACYDAILVDVSEHPARLRSNLLSADRMHFSMAGHAVLAAEMIKALSAQR